MIKEAIYKLINHKDLTYEESLAVMGEMMDGNSGSDGWISDCTAYAGGNH